MSLFLLLPRRLNRHLSHREASSSCRSVQAVLPIPPCFLKPFVCIGTKSNSKSIVTAFCHIALTVKMKYKEEAERRRMSCAAWHESEEEKQFLMNDMFHMIYRMKIFADCVFFFCSSFTKTNDITSHAGKKEEFSYA